MNVREDNVAKFLDGLVFGVGDGHDPGDVRGQTRQLRMAANCIEDGAGSRIRSRGGGHRPIIAPPWGLTSRIAADHRAFPSRLGSGSSGRLIQYSRRTRLASAIRP